MQRINRRTFLGATGAGVLAGPPAQGESPRGSGRKKLAILTTVWRMQSHGQHMGDRFLVGYPLDGKWHRPGLDVVSVYVDQHPKGDLIGQRAEEFGFKVYPTIAEALRQGGDKLAVDAVLIIGKRILVDDGVSAWKGLNATPDHELGKFIADANRGVIRPGDCLLVENLDRISRQDVWAAMGLVNDLRQLKIHVGRLDRMKLLRYDSKDIGDFFESAVEFSRGNSESEAKSMRNSAKWQRRRQEGRENGMTITRRLPAWIQDVNGRRVLIPERAQVVQYIFELSAGGRGLYAIMSKLTSEGVAGFGPSGRWSVSYLGLLLTDRRVLGEFQPRIGSKCKGKPDGEPIKGYFPRVIDDELWYRVRQGAEQRHRRQGKVTADVNVFAGLLKGALDGLSYVAGLESKTGRRTLRSAAPRMSAGKANSFPLETFERSIFGMLKEINPHDILNGDQGPDETIVLAGELARVEASIAALIADMDEHGESPSLMKRVRDKEAQQRELSAKLAEARQKAAHPLSESWGEAQTLLDAIDRAPDKEEARLRLRAALRRIVEEIRLLVVPRGRDRLAAAQIWFAGGERHRDYLILHRPPKANATTHTKGGWAARSFADAGLPGGLDLRKKSHAERLEKALLTAPLPDAK
jgi:DNA invertase Pin-like site-specific DNA recombinase